ncbi:MAG: TIGR01906 family membrane protein [Oscillospiraceae bacterium]|nr:TIGR01906 family membrane protein [Oscillospiraceae bacterium]
MRTIKEKKSIWITCAVVNAICLIVLIFFVGIKLPSFGMWFYTWQYDINDTYAVVNMEPEDLHQVTRHMIRYMQGHLDRDDGLQIETVVGGQTRDFFSEIEIRHMVDVYDLFIVGLLIRDILVILLLFTSIFFLIWGRTHMKILFKAWRYGSAGVILILGTLVAVIAINWHHAFVVFHEIFFDNDYWILDARVDLLVNIVPYPFFITISVFIGVFFAVGLALLFAVSTILRRRLGR